MTDRFDVVTIRVEHEAAVVVLVVVRARARGAFRDCDYSVGIEAGVFKVAAVSPRPFQITMACVTDGAREALGSGPFYAVPPSLVR